MFTLMHNTACINILADATLPGLSEAFPLPFQITRYDSLEQVKALLPHQDILLCRSTLKVTSELLQYPKLRYIATASSGTDHIDTALLQANNITLIDAKGCNAVSVADYVTACLAFLNYKIKNKTAAVVGFGHVGSRVYERLNALGFLIHSYDPPKALLEPSFQSCTLETLSQCGLICIHASLHDDEPYPSRYLINEHILQKLQPGCVIINASRGGIVDEKALLKIQHIIYCTDVYEQEPNINPDVVAYATLATPHIAGHSLEGKYLAVRMVSEQLHRYYGLPLPTQFASPPEPLNVLKTEGAWEEQVLSLYHPMKETLVLKEAGDVGVVFQEVRSMHKRHDFNEFATLMLPSLR